MNNILIKAVILGSSALMAMTLFACAKETKVDVTPTPSTDAQIANPFEECKTMEEAEKLAGFDFAIPKEIEGCSSSTIQVLISEDDNNMIEVIEFDESGEEVMRLRKATGEAISAMGDISGDYNEYPTTEEKNINGNTVTTKSNDNGIKVALWTVDTQVYSITSENGLSLDQLTELVTHIQ